MNRLTDKDCNNYDDFVFSFRNSLITRSELDNGLYRRLKLLEDTQEELGIDLITLFKALENGIYTRDKMWYPLVKLYFEDRNLYCQAKFKNSIIVHLKDYGKTWWLKEDKTE